MPTGTERFFSYFSFSCHKVFFFGFFMFEETDLNNGELKKAFWDERFLTFGIAMMILILLFCFKKIYPAKLWWDLTPNRFILTFHSKSSKLYSNISSLHFCYCHRSFFISFSCHQFSNLLSCPLNGCLLQRFFLCVRSTSTVLSPLSLFFINSDKT